MNTFLVNIADFAFEEVTTPQDADLWDAKKYQKSYKKVPKSIKYQKAQKVFYSFIAFRIFFIVLDPFGYVLSFNSLSALFYRFRAGEYMGSLDRLILQLIGPGFI